MTGRIYGVRQVQLMPNAAEWIGAILIASFVPVMYWIGRGRNP